MHTLPLPEVTDHNQKTKFENGNSKLASAQIAPRASNFDLRVSAGPLHLTPQQLQFLLRVTPAALQSQRKYEIPACVTIAQAILESATPKFGWGSSILFRMANNPFGIKYSHLGMGDSGSENRGSGLGTRGSGSETLTPNPGSRIPNSESPIPSREPRIPDPESRIPNSESPIPNREPRIPDPESRIPNSESPIPNREPRILDPESRIPNSESPIPNCEPRILDPESRIPNSESRTANPERGIPNPDPYGHFDAQTWEIENGQKKVIIAQFQRFPDLDEAFTVHALLLRAPRYRPAFAVRDDWKKFAERLGPKTSPLDTEHCGYSTNPSYSAELIKLVTLYRLNDPRALQWFATGKDPGYRAIEPSDHRAMEPLARRTIGSSEKQGTDELMKRSVSSS